MNESECRHALAATAEHLQEALSVYEVGMSLLDAELLTEGPNGRAEIDLDAVRRRGAAGREWLRERLAQRGFSPEVSAAVLSARTGAMFAAAGLCAVVHGARLLLEMDTLPPLPVLQLREYVREAAFVPVRAADCVTIDAEAVVGQPFVRRVQTGGSLRALRYAQRDEVGERLSHGSAPFGAGKACGRGGM